MLVYTLRLIRGRKVNWLHVGSTPTASIKQVSSSGPGHQPLKLGDIGSNPITCTKPRVVGVVSGTLRCHRRGTGASPVRRSSSTSINSDAPAL